MDIDTSSQPTSDGRGDKESASGSPSEPSKSNLRLYLTRGAHFLVRIIGPSLTVAALLLAIIQLYQANKAERNNKRAAEETKIETQKIADRYKELSILATTQYVDVFPKNMPKIIELIQGTRNSLTVITDVAAYGHFSSPGDSDRYIRELGALSSPERKIEIRLLCYNSNETKRHLKEQFPDFDVLKESPQFDAYKPWHQNDLPQSKDDLINQIDEAGIVFLNSLKTLKPVIRRTSKELPIFMWISDDKTAIFSLHNYGQSPREHSFTTNDPRFIQRLKEIADEAFGYSEEYKPGKE
jgi:hypothetical protein